MIERLIDSVILIDHLNGIDKATNFVFGLDPDKTAISVITRGEILVGLNETQEAFVKAIMGSTKEKVRFVISFDHL